MRQNIQPLSESKECAVLVKNRCECGYGNCKRRQGRAASTCCEEHNDLACCIEGTKHHQCQRRKMPTMQWLLHLKFRRLMLVLVPFVSNLAMAHILV
ncbi:hypothetical protein niasHT_021320 [Heterodera trifolii]|uniref:Uncharacterized protein n=1 Tax=Heterodera trifolii TaxID=157864 RepID=A0ABD2KGN8_9BILA